MESNKELEEKRIKEYKKLQRYKVQSVLGICLVLLIAGAFIFTYFHITTQARLTLREAKNVRLALDMLDVEYYGRNSSVYDPEKRDGLNDGVSKRLYDICGQSGKTELLSYDQKNHKTTCMIYETEHYRVFYQQDEAGKDSWKVDYLVMVMKY